MKDYVGNSLQIRGAERYILEGGKGDGMHFVSVRNGKGLEAWISLDRAAEDLSEGHGGSRHSAADISAVTKAVGKTRGHGDSFLSNAQLVVFV